MDGAISDAKNARDDVVPAYLRDSSYGSKEMKAESGKYLYPHNFGGWVQQQYLPDSLKDRVYYSPSDYGYEATVKQVRKRKGKK